MKWRRPIKYVICAIAIIATALAIFNVQVCCDWAFICENTGSQKGFRHWTFGPKTGHWYKKSPLEEFVAEHESEALVHRWTSFAGTGKNIFGSSILFGHGRPGAVYEFKLDVQKRWIDKHSEEEVLELYDLFVSDDQTEIEKRITEIWEEELIPDRNPAY